MCVCALKFLFVSHGGFLLSAKLSSGLVFGVNITCSVFLCVIRHTCERVFVQNQSNLTDSVRVDSCIYIDDDEEHRH